MTNKAIITFLFLGISSTFFSCMEQVYFISDPYWETVTSVSFFEVRRMGLKHGVIVRIVRTTDNTTWLTSNTQRKVNPNDLNSLKFRIENLLADGYKVILSPFWWRDLEQEIPQSSTGQMLLLGAVSQNPQIQSVISDLEAGYYKMGQVAASFMQQHPERQRAIAMFYRGSSYDKYFASFSAGYNSQNSSPANVQTHRYYAAEINELNLALEKIDADKNLIILGMAQLSNLIYRRLLQEENALFMVEDFGDSPDPYQQILLSLDIDYRQLMNNALMMDPLAEGEKSQANSASDNNRIQPVPYILNLPNPELLLDIKGMETLAEEAIAQKKRQYNRLDLLISRGWEQLLTFILEFHISDIPLPQWPKL